jgi:hypothetical protein
MPTYRGIDKFTPEMTVAVIKFIQLLKEKKVNFYITETWRDQLVQDAYYAQGRKALGIVNELRVKAGLAPIGISENRIITQTTNSKHTLGKAIDIYPLDSRGGPWWTAAKFDFMKIVECGKAAGLQWGGDWKGFVDLPHWEI